MKQIFGSLLFAALICGSGTAASAQELGEAEGRCRDNERGPAFMVRAIGLKDRQGNLKVEVYPDNDEDFLRDDSELVNAGKAFSRVIIRQIPATSAVDMCIRVPRSGRYSVVVLHDRDENRSFGWRVDGVGFANNPRLGWSQPDADEAAARAGTGLTRLDVVLNYRRGLAMRPLDN